MVSDNEIKVQFSIKVTRTYTIDEIDDFVDFNSLVSDDMETTLKQMIIIDTIDAINMGHGSFKILE